MGGVSSSAEEPATQQRKSILGVDSVLTNCDGNFYTIRIPPGVSPGGNFSAVCDGQIIRVEVPEDAAAGDFLQVDLDNEEEDSEDHKSFKERQLDEVIREAASLFIKYDTDSNQTLNTSEFHAMLQMEYDYKPQSAEIKLESSLANISKHNEITFDEFLFWFRQYKVRMQHQNHQSKHQQIKHQELSEEELENLKSENEKLQDAFQRQKLEFELEMKRLTTEKERVRKRKQTFRPGDADFKKLAAIEARHTSQFSALAEQKETNEQVISKMKDDFLFLNEEREKRAQEQRKKLQAKIEAKRRAAE